MVGGEEEDGWGGRRLFTEMVGGEESKFGQYTAVFYHFGHVYIYPFFLF